MWVVTAKEVVIFNPVTGQTVSVNTDPQILNKIKSILITQKEMFF